MRNIDEWLCNLYIEVKKIELFDFREHNETINFSIPRKILKMFEKQRKQSARVIKRENHINIETPSSSESTDEEKHFESSSEEEESDDD